jgi:hypothetical protein
MNTDAEIEETLRRLGSAEPPPGLARRVELRLQIPRRSFFLTVPQAIAACAVAGSVAVSAVVFQPALRRLVLPHANNAQTLPLVETPRVAPVTPGFGTASAVHVPVAPVPVEPTPVNHGRGRSRSGRTELPSESLTPLPRGVAAPNSLPER